MDKVRVYELARDLGITSPEAIALLKEKLKIRVKSASSTIPEDTATKLKRLLRLEGASASRTKAAKAATAAASPAKDGADKAKLARKARAEKARLALLEEMDAEERAEKEKVERAKREKEESERREAEEAAQKLAEEEQAREAAAAAVALAELTAIGEEDDTTQAEPEPTEALTPQPAETEASEPVGVEPPPMPGPMDRRVDLSPKKPKPLPAPELPPLVSPAEASRSTIATPASPELAPPSTLPAAPPAPGSPAAPRREQVFKPGPTSQYVRTRPPPPRSPRPAPGRRPGPAPPRPAAPIKRVGVRGAPDGRPKPKRKTKRGSTAPVPDVNEQSLPEPIPRADDRKAEAPKIHTKISLTEGVTVKELAEKLEAKHKDVIKVLMGHGVLATINQTLGADTATEIAKQFGAEVEMLTFEEDVLREEAKEEKPEDLSTRSPVVTVMGHVDHGKTSLLDGIRETKVQEQEAGGITQHVGAYSVDVKNRHVVFLDTPGHEAFTMMRARGASVTDLVVLVVAADDGVMPQTKEAIDHARAAEVPLLVAINKIDKSNANPERVKKQLSELELVPEDWGGNTVFVEVSAKKREGLDLLLEMILLVSDLRELKANPSRAGMGTVLEAKLDKGKGPVAHVLVQNGSVSIGDPFVAGAVHGKVRAMFDDRGRKIKNVGPSTPVEILGLTALPQAGDQFQVFPDSFKARQISDFRMQKVRERELASSARLTLDQLHRQVEEGTVKDLPIIIKTDVQGSVEVLKDALPKLSTAKVKVKIIHAGVGAITENDVTLALASNAVIIGFNVRPERSAEELANRESVDIRMHTVIYNITDELKKAMEGMLDPTFKEVTLGRAEVRETFKVPKIGLIAGCYVSGGKVLRNAEIRLLRDNVVVFEGKIGSLRRFKEDSGEVKEGFECGIGIAGYNDVKVGDVIEAFTMETVQPTPA